jgi:bifunctional non-homologous end joining protein LigD
LGVSGARDAQLPPHDLDWCWLFLGGQTLVRLLHGPYPGMALNEHFVGDGDIVYRPACMLGCEGIVSKRLGSTYRSGRFRDWVKVTRSAARSPWPASHSRLRSRRNPPATS